MLTTTQAEQVLETVLLCAGRRLTTADLLHLFEGQFLPGELDILLSKVAKRWEGRGIMLDAKPGSWGVKCKPELQGYLRRLYTAGPLDQLQEALDCLTIIAFKQPLTRTEIAMLRNRPASHEMLAELISRGWVVTEPGDPEPLYRTTDQFLQDFRLSSLDELPTRFESP